MQSGNSTKLDRPNAPAIRPLFQAEGSFAWMDGSNVDFVAWAPFQPDRAGWEEDAVSVIRTIIAGIWIAFFREYQQ